MEFKNAYIIAGPNGAGKTTFANKFLPEYIKCPQFINADLISQGLSPFAPQQAAIKAGRLVLEQIIEYKNKGFDFAFETTLSGKIYQKHFKELKDAGYQLHLFFLWVPSSQLALARIKERVSAGGHNVPAQDVLRRFSRSISNLFKIYRYIVDSWMFFDNAGLKPTLIAYEKNANMTIVDKDLFLKIIKNIGVEI